MPHHAGSDIKRRRCNGSLAGKPFPAIIQNFIHKHYTGSFPLHPLGCPCLRTASSVRIRCPHCQTNTAKSSCRRIVRKLARLAAAVVRMRHDPSGQTVNTQRNAGIYWYRLYFCRSDSQPCCFHFNLYRIQNPAFDGVFTNGSRVCSMRCLGIASS